MLEIEIWEPIYINDNKTIYEISSSGRVRSKKKGKVKILKPSKCGSGYYKITMYHKGKYYQKMIHSLVASVFIKKDDPYNKLQVNHIDGNKLNNSVNNLEWVTRSENIRHALKLNLSKPKKGKDVHFCKIDESIAHQICVLLSLGIRPKKISKILGISRQIIQHIKSKNSWKHISSQYNF